MSSQHSHPRQVEARAATGPQLPAVWRQRGRDGLMSVGGLMLWALVHAPLGQRAHQLGLGLVSALIDVERPRRREPSLH